MSTPKKILIVEDHVELAEIIGEYLTAQGYKVQLIHDGGLVMEQVRVNSPDMILLDIMLPNVDGIEICRRVRQFSSIPIIMMTAKVDEIDRILGLDIGADDYICKPVRPKEVVARVNAVFRRTNWGDSLTTTNQGLHIDESQYSVSWNDKTLKLTPVEFRLLDFMFKEKRIHSRAALMNVIYEDDRYVYDRTVDSHIKNLRKKLATIAELENSIRSVYGVGYIFEFKDE